MADDKWKHVHNGGGGAVYGLGLIGALVYFLPHANTFGQVVMGIVKSIVWPAIFVFQIFRYLNV